MAECRFLQIHYLTSFPASLLNRDDVGLAKRIPFGGISRIRISSQCLKRHWRTAEGPFSLGSLGTPLSIRSRKIFEKEIVAPLIKEGFPQDLVARVVNKLQDLFLGKSKKRERSVESEEDETVSTEQLIVLGRPEVEYILKTAREILQECGEDKKKLDSKLKELEKDKNLRENFKALAENCKAVLGLDAALFGRMVTSDILARGDAAVHVAHAFTVHTEETETDFFTAVDDLQSETEELGSAHMNETELTSGLFYGYVVVDIPQLVSNIEGCDRKEWLQADRTLSGSVVSSLIHLIATVSPGAKRGSTAPYSYAQFMLAEFGERQPRTLANAFLKPVDLSQPDILKSSISALSRYLKNFDRMYGLEEKRRVVAMVDTEDFPAEPVPSLGELAEWANSLVKQGKE